MRRVNYIDEEESEEESSDEEEQLVLRVDGKEHKPFYMERQMCGKWFKAIIDTGSPVSIFTNRPPADHWRKNGSRTRHD